MTTNLTKMGMGMMTRTTKRLDGLRREIDRVDRMLVRLLNRRASGAVKIGVEKKRQHSPIQDPVRERKILARVGRLNRGPLSPQAMAKVFSEIISVCRNLQQK